MDQESKGPRPTRRNRPLLEILEGKALLAIGDLGLGGLGSILIPPPATPTTLQYAIHLDSITTKDGGDSFDVAYHFDGRPPAQSDIILYWASGTTWDSKILVKATDKTPGGEAGSISPTDPVTNNGKYVAHIVISDARLRPPMADHLLVLTGPAHHDAKAFDALAKVYNIASVKLNGITSPQLRAIMPGLSKAKAEAFVRPLNDAMAEFGINSPEQEASFLSQLAVESVQLTRWREGSNYNKDNPQDPGNGS